MVLLVYAYETGPMLPFPIVHHVKVWDGALLDVVIGQLDCDGHIAVRGRDVLWLFQW